MLTSQPSLVWFDEEVVEYFAILPKPIHEVLQHVFPLLWFELECEFVADEVADLDDVARDS